ncbi:NifU-like protein 5, mitochondrial [Phytophthora ramorum]|uniref:NifU-like protein 5, mitochondrial n=1 Tax=Phytophthora ramorum TaxID=164328 RepID=UPI0030A2DA27|nr:NifU-like protein 5, mitochondrial [Phytophthora ramorum]
MQFYCEDYHSVLALLEDDTNRFDSYAVRRALAEFKRLALHRNSVRHAMVAEGRLLPALVAIASSHVQEQQGAVLADCCRLFQRLISHKQPTELDIQSKITEAGGLGLMLKGLVAHPNARRLYTEACRLVTLLCFDTVAAPHADNQAAIADAGLFAAICERLESAGISEEETAAGCAAISALVYENDSNGAAATHTFHILSKFSTLLSLFPESLRIVRCVFQTLFQLMTMEAGLSDDVVDAGMMQQLVELLDSSSLMQEYRGAASFMAHWHIVKFLELCIRENDSAKEAFCSCAGPAVVVNTMIRRRQEPRHADGIDPWSLQYISCMLLCRVATVSGDPPVTDKIRAMQLVQSSAHQLALDILRSVGIARLADASEASRTNFWASVEQSVRLLELIAALEDNRVPLTRLGASRQVKLIYNNPERRTIIFPRSLQLLRAAASSTSRCAGRPLHYKRGLYAQLGGGAIGLQIEGVLFSKDFVSVIKTEDERWDVRRLSVEEEGMSDEPIITDTTIMPEDAEVVAMTKEPLEQRIRPSVQDGGGNIFRQGFDEKTGMVTV